MSIVRVHNFSVSLDGFATGADQTIEAPFGHAGTKLLDWALGTRTFQTQIHGGSGGTTGVDDAYASTWKRGIGAEIMGRNKFGPTRNPEWTGWWGDDPVFGTPVFVLTHETREPIECAGGTTFHFIDETPKRALEIARAAAGELDVRIGGGPTVVRDFLDADLIDHMHIALVPIVLGRGVRLWDGLEGLETRFDIEAVASPSGATHLTFTRRPRG